MPHETIVVLTTSLLCSLYPFSYRGVVCTSRYLFLHVVLISSFHSIAVLPTTLIFRTFARYSLFLFCLFYNTLHILASSSSQRALSHSLQWYLDPIELDSEPYVLVITTSFTSSFFPSYSAKIQSVRKLALKIGQKSLLLYVVFITSLGCSNPRITQHKIYTAFRGVYVLS